jgi:hypothetical protein
VHVRNDSRPVYRSTQSELDRRAISMVGHLLTTGIWLEHQLRNAVTPPTRSVGRSRVRSTPPRLGSIDWEFTKPTRKQPSPTPDLAVISR